MTAAGDAVLAVAYSQVGVTESPPNSNVASPYTDPWGPGAWCAMFVSWCMAQAGYPLPNINGPAGFSYCPSGQQWGYAYDGSNVDLQPGDVLIFSWEPWHMEGGQAICSSGAYAGAPAGDHTGFWAGGGMTVEGNTSQSSWDNGGAVMERGDRYGGQICCTWRPAVIAGGGATPEPPKPKYLTEDDMVIVFGPGGAALVGPGYWCNLDGEGYEQWSAVPGMVVHSVGQRGWDVMRYAALFGADAADAQQGEQTT